MDSEQFEPQASLFKALMHPVRLAILEILRNDEECVCHMEVVLGLKQSYISQQLTVLRDAGLVDIRRDKWNIFYRVIEPRVWALLDAAGVLTGQATRMRARRPGRRVRVENCGCPKCAPVAEDVAT